MTFKDALKRAFATFVAGATAAPITAAAFNVSFFKAAGIAGAIAVWNLLGRLVQVWNTPLPDEG